MTRNSLDRRGFLSSSASLGGALALAGTTARAEESSGCPAPHTPPSIGPQVGVAFVEAFSGTLTGSVTACRFQLTLEVPALLEFLSGPHRALVSGGWLEVDGQPRVAVESGHAELFRDCPGNGAKELTLEFEYTDAAGRKVRAQGSRSIADPNQRDAAAQLSELSLTLSVGGELVASGLVTTHVDELLARLSSVRALRASGAEAEAARLAFFELLNRQCSSVHGALPSLLAGTNPLTPGERRALLLLSTVMLPKQLPSSGPTLPQLVDNLDTFMAYADADAVATLRQQLRTLGGLGQLKAGIIDKLRKVVLGALRSESPNPLRPLLDSVHKVAVLGYYSHPAADALVGYHRPKFVPLFGTRLPIKAAPSERTFDVVIVGAGVAGSLLAERLSAKGKSVLLLEAGPYVPEAELTPDELVWVARLQKASGLQRSNVEEPLASHVGNVVMLQAACVGGGGVINNAVNFMLPSHRLEQWLGLGFPIAAKDLRQSYVTTGRELAIGPVSEKTRFLNPVCQVLENAFGKPQKPELAKPIQPGFFECMVNLVPDGCLGCGMCNTGCGSERKRNALQVHLPLALGAGRDTELVANARVCDVLVEPGANGAQRVTSLVVQTAGGKVHVRGRQYVLSAGAIQSSALMLGSPSLARAVSKLPVGRRFCANVVSPMLAFYDAVLHRRPSLQLTHYYVPPDQDDGFLIENLFNPPGQSALIVPGYGELHQQRMSKYVSTALMGIAIGTTANGTVSLDAQGRARTTLPMGENEHRRMRTGFRLLAHALLRGGGGLRPTEILCGSSGDGFSIKTPADVERFEHWFSSPSRVLLSTGHPQGGCAMSDDARISVVDAEFRVRGIENLRVCDASVFPMVSGVNPQWTVLAIADRCAHVMNETS
jgi:choline dehydrogenase-like flavoprotein